ncbi:MAG: hypothetical protein ACFFDW_14965 [Candidatus Thorarchaeota archaeon]
MSTTKTKKISKIQTEISSEEKINENLEPVIIIHGAASTKVGFGGEKFPRFVIPNQSTILSERIKRFPLEGSRPLSEEWIKAFWDGIIAKLKVNLSERKVLLSLPTAHLANCPFRELAQEYFYNDLQAYKIAVVSDPFLSLVNYIPNINNNSI